MNSKYPWQLPEGDSNELLNGLAAEYNVLIAGTVGSGKSVLVNSIIHNLLLRSPDDCKLYLCDPKQVELYQYSALPHCVEYADTVDSILYLLENVHAEMLRRYSAARAAGLKKYAGADTYLIIDELADLMTSSRRKAVIDVLARIMQLSRAARIHVIACTQSPARLVLPAQIQVNFTCRIGLHCMSAIESKQAINAPGCECLPLYGNGYIVNASGKQRVIIPMIDDDDIAERVEYWLIQADEKRQAEKYSLQAMREKRRAERAAHIERTTAAEPKTISYRQTTNYQPATRPKVRLRDVFRACKRFTKRLVSVALKIGLIWFVYWLFFM